MNKMKTVNKQTKGDRFTVYVVHSKVTLCLFCCHMNFYSVASVYVVCLKVLVDTSCHLLDSCRLFNGCCLLMAVVVCSTVVVCSMAVVCLMAVVVCMTAVVCLMAVAVCSTAVVFLMLNGCCLVQTLLAAQPVVRPTSATIRDGWQKKERNFLGLFIINI